MRSFLIAVLVAALAAPAFAAPRSMPNLDEYVKLEEKLCGPTAEGVPVLKFTEWRRAPEDVESSNAMTDEERANFEWNFVYVLDRLSDGAAIMERVYGNDKVPTSRSFGVKLDSKSEWRLFDKDELKAANEAIGKVFPPNELRAATAFCR